MLGLTRGCGCARKPAGLSCGRSCSWGQAGRPVRAAQAQLWLLDGAAAPQWEAVCRGRQSRAPHGVTTPWGTLLGGPSRCTRCAAGTVGGDCTAPVPSHRPGGWRLQALGLGYGSLRPTPGPSTRVLLQGWEGAAGAPRGLLQKDTDPSLRAPPVTSSLPQSPTPLDHHHGVRISAQEVWEGTDIQPPMPMDS